MKHLLGVHKNIYNDLNDNRRSIKNPDRSSQNKLEKYMKQTNFKTIVLQTGLEKLKTIAVELIYFNGRPLSILSDSAMERLFSALVKQLGDYSINRNNIKAEIKERANIFRCRIKKDVKDKVVCIKADIETGYKSSILGINCQVIKKE